MVLSKNLFLKIGGWSKSNGPGVVWTVNAHYRKSKWILKGWKGAQANRCFGNCLPKLGSLSIKSKWRAVLIGDD
jgi:hypothetical protein